METDKPNIVLKESIVLYSLPLGREVQIDFYLPPGLPEPGSLNLLLINDGQDLGKLGLETMLEDLYDKEEIKPMLCAGIHAGPMRKMEYGTRSVTDFKGRGARASSYTQFIFETLIPYIRKQYARQGFKEKAFAGFSLGGLSALDIVWNHAQEFSKVGVFSGAFWWRTKDKNDKSYDDSTDRIIHQEIRKGDYYPWLKFFFECGAADEEEDRNSNGIIDSIDDTLDLIKELSAKGYDSVNDIHYLQLDDGRHDIETWARSMPVFLKWAFGIM
jgi:enterochelin esterase-like enzyme